MKNTEAGVFSKNYKSTVAGVSLKYLTIITTLKRFFYGKVINKINFFK